MVKKMIGENAGIVWNALNVHDELSIKDLSKLTGLYDPVLYMAIGWLSKENKLTFNTMNNDLKVSLMEKTRYFF